MTRSDGEVYGALIQGLGLGFCFAAPFFEQRLIHFAFAGSIVAGLGVWIMGRAQLRQFEREMARDDK